MIEIKIYFITGNNNSYQMGIGVNKTKTKK